MSLRNYAAPGLTLLSLTAMTACLQPPDYPLEPVLTFEGISRDSMIQGAGTNDSIAVLLSFTDGDGDIAPTDDDADPNVFLVNRRTGEEQSRFVLNPIPEEGAENGISGSLQLRVYTTCCDYPDFVTALLCSPSDQYPVDTLSLEAYLVDRAGNESNRVDLPPVYLICDRAQ